MRSVTTLLLAISVIGFSAQAFAQSGTPPQVSPADAKDHVGETVTVCGKVVDTKVNKYGIARYGKPVLFFFDRPEQTADFYFVTFGSKDEGPDEAIAAYKDKSLCVTGKITLASGKPYIMAADRTHITAKAESRPE